MDDLNGFPTNISTAMKTNSLLFSITLLTILGTPCAAQVFVSKDFNGPVEPFGGYHWADFNADGLSDILEVNFFGHGIIHISNGDSFLSTSIPFDDVYFDEDVTTLNDYDGDGDLDMLARQDHFLVIIQTGENGSFTLINTGIEFTYAEIGTMFWLDIDGDLDLDIIQGRMIYLNDGGTHRLSRFLLPENLFGIKWDDFNADGLPDMAAGFGYDSYNGSEVHIFLNQGEGMFATAGVNLSSPNLKASSLAILDVDSDGDADLFVTDLYAVAWVYQSTFAQDGTVSFKAVRIAEESSVESIPGDFNSDGLPDIAIRAWNEVIVLQNSSIGSNVSFAPTTYAVEYDNLYSFDVVDADHDKDLDVHLKAYSSQGGDVDILFENGGNAIGTPPSAPAGFTATLTDNVILSWNATPGVLYNLEVKCNGVIKKASATSAVGTLLGASGNILFRDGSVQLFGLPAGDYECRLQAVAPSGHSSAFTSPVNFSIGLPPTSLTLQALHLTSVNLCWEYGGPGTPSFQVYRGSPEGSAAPIALVPAGVYCYMDASAPANTVVEYFVVAITDGVSSAPSEVVTHHSTVFVPTSFGQFEPNIINARSFTADYDMDGDYDLEFIGRIGSWDNDFLMKNDGSGSFNAEGSIIPAESIHLPYFDVAGPRDLDNDGDPDFVLITGNDYSWQRVSVFKNNDGTFIKAFETPAYLGVQQVAAEDMNNDGRVDILFAHRVGNSSGNPLKHELLYQTLDGEFEDSRIDFNNESAMEYFTCADLNSDGFLDLLVAYAGKTRMAILVNEKGTAFRTVATMIPTSYKFGVADYTGDGIVDVMAIGHEGLHLYAGSGDFAFREPKVIPIDYLSGTPDFVHADIDLDGWTDLILSDGYNVRVMLSNGNGSLRNSNITLKHDYGTSVTCTDFENDGDIDLVKTGNDSQHQGINYLYRNQLADIKVTNAPPAVPPAINASFDSGRLRLSWDKSTDDRTPSNLLTYNLRITDANGKVWLSGDTDPTNGFRSRFGRGNTGYSTSMELNDMPVGVYKARVQAIDASFASSPWSKEIDVTIYPGPDALSVERIFLNKVLLKWHDGPMDESNVFVERRTTSSGWQVVQELPPGTTSFTDAGLEYNKIYQYRIFETGPNGGTSASNVIEWDTRMWILTETEMPNLYGSIDAADFTGDGRIDLVVNGGMIYNGYFEDITRATYENTEDGWIKRDITPSDLSHNAQFKFTDLNGDYKPDLYGHGYMASTFDRKTEFFENNGDKTFSSSTNVFTQGTYSMPGYFDYDMDNDLDVSASQAGSYPYRSDLFQNQGYGTYASVATSWCTTCPTDVASADFDGDGDEDLLRREGSDFSIYLNSPKGLISSTSFPGYESWPVVVDYNGDGLPDIIMLTSANYREATIYQNLGLQGGNSPVFNKIPFTMPNGESSLLSADFDHDGRTDIAHLSPNITVFLNKGNDEFDDYTVPGFRLSSHHSALIDFDDDGDLDIYLSGYHTIDFSHTRRKAQVLVNQTIVSGKGITNAPPATPSGLHALQDSLGMHLSWNSPTDDHTSPEGLTFDVVLYRDGLEISKAYHDPSTGQRIRLSPGRSTGLVTLNNLLPGEYSWRVQAVDMSFAASDFSEHGSFVFLPPPPAINDTVLYTCGRTVSLHAEGSNIEWYADKALTQLLAAGEYHPEVSQTVFVVQIVDGYRGIPKRIQITVYDKPPVPSLYNSNPHTICSSVYGFTQLWAVGSDIRWYADESTDTLLSTGASLSVATTDATYFVTQTFQECESEPLAVSVKVIHLKPRLFYFDEKIYCSEPEAEFYYWYKDGFYHLTTTVPYIQFDGEVATWEVAARVGPCQAYSEPFVSSEENFTSTEEMPDTQWNIYPNPTTSRTTVRLNAGKATITIHDSIGRKFYSGTVDATGELVIDAARWPAGVYLVVVNDGKKYGVKRLSIQ